MADDKGGTSGWGIALNLVGAMLGLLVFGAGGCDSGGVCSCPPPPDFAYIDLGCVPVEQPVAKTTGPCSVCPNPLANGSAPDGSHCETAGPSQRITLVANDAGTCHVELTFGGGATSSVDVDFTSVWTPCGSDPHGCGQGFVAGTNPVSVPDPMCDAGLDAKTSD
jgi:hypothetical protein